MVFNVISVDDGYGDIKYSTNEKTSLVPSFVTSFKPKPSKEIINKDDSNLQYIASKIDSKEYLVGDYAIRLDPNIKWIGGEHKHKDSRFPVLFKTVLGAMSSYNINEIDLLMMGLPIKYNTPNRIHELKSVVKGAHDVNISYDGVNFLKREIIVNNIDVKMQPFGSLCDTILNEKGEIINTEIAKGFNVIVDIGARTLNIMTVEALKEQPELTTHSNDGMFVAYTEMGNYLESELGVIIPDGKLPQIVHDKSIGNKDISPLINQVYKNHANTILSILDKIFINSWGFITAIIFTGGGSELLRGYLEGRFKSVKTVFLDRYSNAKGLRKYGVRQMKNNLKKSRFV